MLDLEDIIIKVRAALSEKRFSHTLGVAGEAKKLALKWGANDNSAYIAGIVHDYAKEIPVSQAYTLLSSFGSDLSDDYLACPALLHGPLCTFLLQRDFGIEDTDILNAVRYHTTGRANMSLLEKIIYLADFIEPSRKFDGVDTVRKLAYENLDKAVLKTADMTIIFNIEKNVFLHTDTIKARNYLLTNQ